MLHLINTGVSSLRRVSALQDFCVFYSFKDFIVLFCVLLHCKSSCLWAALLKSRAQLRGLETVGVVRVFVTLKVSNQSDGAVTPSAVGSHLRLNDTKSYFPVSLHSSAMNTHNTLPSDTHQPVCISPPKPLNSKRGNQDVACYMLVCGLDVRRSCEVL